MNECSICGSKNDKLISEKSLSSSLVKDLELIFNLTRKNQKKYGVCARCLEQTHIKVIQNNHNIEDAHNTKGFTVLPIKTRLNAHQDYTGKGVTICFIDSGFVFHEDLTHSKDRIKKYLDITQSNLTERPTKPEAMAWHGTMTSVVGAGNGFLSNGVFQSLAPDAGAKL